MVFVFLDFPGQFVQHAGGVLDFAQQLLDVQRWAFGLLKSPLGNADDLVQLSLQGVGGRRRRRLLLGFEEQFRLFQDAFARLAFGTAPGVVDCRGLARGPALVGENVRHPEALLEAHSRYRHQIAHGDLGADFAFAHLLLDCFRQRFHQRQPARHPTGAAIQALGQVVDRVAEPLFHFRQQPALFERAVRLAHAERAFQQ